MKNQNQTRKRNQTRKMIFPCELSESTRIKLFDFVDALCAEFPELNSKIRSGVLRLREGTLGFAVRLQSIHDLERWFWTMVSRNEETSCWEWRGARDEHGYGVIKFAGQRILAHRASLLLVTGFDSESLGLHRCDNPPCVNPFHLYRGTYKNNGEDTVARNRKPSVKGRLNPNSKFITFDGRTLSLREWENELGVCRAALYKRLKLWPVERALTEPPRKWK